MRMTLWLSKPKDPNDSSLEEVDTPQMHDSEECIQDSPTFSTPGASMESTPKTPEGLDYDIVLRNARHLKKYKVSEINYDILFKDTWNNLDFADVIDKLYIVFEDVIRRVTGNLKNTDQIRVYINQYSLETPITVPLMLVGDLGPQQILDAIEKVLQSAKKIVFDQSLQVIFGTALVPVAGGELYPHKMQDPAHIKRKRSMVYITEQGHMCMARAICVGTFALKDRKKYEATRRVHSKAQTLEAPFDKNHVCKISCNVCKYMPCLKKQVITCVKCNMVCRSLACLKRHSKPRKLLPSMCDSYWRCDKCKAILVSKLVNRSQHTCGDLLCQNCKNYAPSDHICYIRYAPPKKPSLKYIFYDFESIQETGKHVPNLCIALKICHECINNVGSCANCGDSNNNNNSYHIFDKGEETVDIFCNWLFDEQNKGYVCIAHNAKGYDSHFCISYLMRNSIKPEVIFTGSKIMLLHVRRGLNIRLIDSLNFMKMGLKDLPKCFGLTGSKKGDFPHLFNRTENQNYKGKYPDLKYYNTGSMKSTEREHFLKWYEEVKDETFDFKKELVAYCLNDVEILAKSCIKFRELFMDAAGVDPLQTITVSSACIASFRSKFCQELYDIDGTSTVITGRIFPKHNTKTFIKSYFPFIKPNKDVFSAAAIKWLEWMAAKNNIFIAHACNLGEYRVPGTKYRLDGYHAESKTAYEFHSCLHHGCTICYPFREFRILHLNKKVDELYNLTMIKKKILLDRGFLYICIWHHEYLEKANTDIEFKKFIDSQDVPERLDPRDALYGGRTNAVQLYYKPEIGEKIRYVDFTSLYPYINKTREYMTCPPVIITRGFKDINSYFGFIKCVILPPRGLYHPVLPYRTGGKLLFPLCSTCADAGINRRCKCSDKDRSLKGTWTTVEIQKALSLQYKIVKIYEVWHYPETTIYSSTSKGLFSDYINTFLKFKEQSSGYPSTCVTVKDQEEYKQAYFEKEGVILGDMSPNPGLRSVAKLSLNNIWGKLAQRNNMSQVLFCDKPSDFFMALTDPTKIVTDFKIITDVMVMLVYTNSSESVSTPIFSNVAIASLTTSYARLHLYSVIEKLGDRVLYYDTDSVIYIEREGEWSPETGSYLGELKDEIPGDSIIEYVSGGPKNYAYNTLKGHSVVKVRGITLNHDNAKLVNLSTMKDLIENQQTHVEIPDTKFVRSKKDFSIRTVASSKKYILTPFSSKSFDISICKGLFTTLVVLGIHQCVETFPPPVLPPLSLSTIYCFFFSLTGTQ
ncbi:putative DNA polymerase [Nymphon striatum]|nr:putative DNA polymerase [Nymphon striatum]